MPRGDWSHETLGEACVTITDGAHFSPREDPGGLPMASVKDLTRHGIDLSSCKRISKSDFEMLKRQGCMPEPGDVLIAKDGNSALDTVCVYRQPTEVVLLSSIAILRPGPQLDPQFLRYYLDAPATRDLLKSGYRSGSAIPRVVLQDFRRAPVPLPPIAEQRAIAAVLGALDDKIELNRQVNDTLEAMARGLFRSWFVDFDPVRAKAEGRDPGLPKPIANLFPDRFEDFEAGEVPAGWRWTRLVDCVELMSGHTPSKSRPEFWGGDTPWISPKAMTAVHADEAEEYLTRAAVDGSRLAPRLATLVMVRGMGLHREVRVSQARQPVAFNQDVKALVPRGIEPSLLLFALLDAQPVLLGRVESSGHGTGRLPTERLAGYVVALPPANVRQSLAQPFEMINERIAVGRAESRALAALRDVLIPKLISGAVRVPQAERLLEPVQA